jgi:hypothetical protein
VVLGTEIDSLRFMQMRAYGTVQTIKIGGVMGSREFPYEENSRCETCNRLGAYDIYGDMVCGPCLDGSCSRCAIRGCMGECIPETRWPEGAEL